MNSKVKGILLGTLASLGGIVLWVIFGAFLEIISGWAGALMGVAFLIVYKKFNPGDKSPLAIIIAFLLVAIEVFIAELITIAIIANTYELALGAVFADADMQGAIMSDLLIGYAFSFGTLLIYIIAERQKNKQLEKVAAAQNAQRIANEAAAAKAAETQADPLQPAPKSVDPFASTPMSETAATKLDTQMGEADATTEPKSADYIEKI